MKSKARTVKFKPEQSDRRGSVYMTPTAFERLRARTKRWGLPQKSTLEVLINLALDKEGAP